MWSTEDELAFINRIGISKLPKRLDLLLGYKTALEVRAEWGDVDQVIVEHALAEAIRKEIARRAMLVVYEKSKKRGKNELVW